MQSVATVVKEEVWNDNQSTTTQFPSTSYSYGERPSFAINLKVIGILLGGIIFVFAVTRLCLMLYNSSRSSNRRASTVQPQVTTIELNQFKPDIPPAYAEAVANIDTDDSKLPSYDELRHSDTRQT